MMSHRSKLLGERGSPPARAHRLFLLQIVVDDDPQRKETHCAINSWGL